MGFYSMVNRIPQKISGRVGLSSGNYQLQSNIFDWALGGVPLLSATDDQKPDVESPVDQRKQQFDSYKDPGEYSLNQWWLRSQSEFNGGAGIVYQDPDTQDTYLITKNTRYETSLGIDPFTDYSQISLLRQANPSAVLPTGLDQGFSYNAFLQTFNSSTGGDNVFIARGHSIYNATVGVADITLNGTAVLPTETGHDFGITGGIAYLGGGAQGGNEIFVYQDQFATGDDGVWSCTEAGITTNIYAGDGLHNMKVIKFAKGQLLLSSGNNLYQLNTTGSRTALPTPVAVAPQGQVITSMTEGPDAVYVSANDGYCGYVYKTTYATTPVTLINGLEQIAVLPAGEQINDIAFYVGTYLILATDQGARVASVSATGLSYSPLNFNFPKKVGQTNGCKGIAFYGTVAVIGTYSYLPQHDGAWGTFAIDLGTVNTDNVTGFTTNAWTRWTYNSGTAEPVWDVAVTQSGRVLYTSLIPSNVIQGTLWVEHATNLVSEGYLQTGRCRFNTLAPKLFKYFSIRTPPLEGSLSVSVLDAGGGETPYITYTNAISPEVTDVSITYPYGQQDYIQLKFYLFASTTAPSQGASMNGWQIKALPGETKQRTLSKWFLCFNNQQDKAGNRIGGDLYALDTLNQIRLMCQRGDTVNFQDLINNVSTSVVIDTYQFVMMAPPGPNQENYGGYLKINMRTVADDVPPIPATVGQQVD
jgi:hypothetical protein